MNSGDTSAAAARCDSPKSPKTRNSRFVMTRASRRALLILAVVWAVATVVHGGERHRGEESAPHFTNEWVVRVEGGQRAARALAEEMGYDFQGNVRGFQNTYRMVKRDYPRVHKRGHSHLTQRLAADARVVWAEQQYPKQRVKRSLPEGAKVVLDTRISGGRNRDEEFIVQRRPQLFNDELWPEQWYMQDTRTRSNLPKLDLHVLPVYAMGYSGRGVRVCVLDDGVERTHEDLKGNFDDAISYDANDEDEDPTPRYDESGTNAHGTRCAGEIAMAANNHKCGVGIAFGARVGGIRMLDGDVSDRVEGTALGHAHDLVDIYSASWGPNDDGKTVEGPGRLAIEAIERGIKEGRAGRGIIYVWASGNGGLRGDNCDCDGYIGSIYTLAIGSASQQGQFPWYGERCAATMAVTYSSGAYSDQMIATTDLGNTCTVKHTGTSASAPLAAGIIALALEVNPNLTWRDVQHLVVWTSEYAPLRDNEGWQRSAAGYYFNTRFGFGLMNAAALCAAAANWTTVPPAHLCSAPATKGTNSTLEAGMAVELEFDTDACAGTNNEINYLEHVQMEVNIEYSERGRLQLFLTSAAGTRVQLLSTRRLDKSPEGFVAWRFLSVLTWGERASGRWTLEIHATPHPEGGLAGFGRVGACTLLLHGTREMPTHLTAGPRRYDLEYNRVHRKTGKDEVEERDEEWKNNSVQPNVETGGNNDIPVTLDSLQREKGHEALNWADLQGQAIALRKAQEQEATQRYTMARRWIQDFFNKIF